MFFDQRVRNPVASKLRLAQDMANVEAAPQIPAVDVGRALIQAELQSFDQGELLAQFVAKIDDESWVPDEALVAPVSALTSASPPRSQYLKTWLHGKLAPVLQRGLRVVVREPLRTLAAMAQLAWGQDAALPAEPLNDTEYDALCQRLDQLQDSTAVSKASFSWRLWRWWQAAEQLRTAKDSVGNGGVLELIAPISDFRAQVVALKDNYAAYSLKLHEVFGSHPLMPDVIPALSVSSLIQRADKDMETWVELVREEGVKAVQRVSDLAPAEVLLQGATLPDSEELLRVVRSNTNAKAVAIESMHLQKLRDATSKSPAAAWMPKTVADNFAKALAHARLHVAVDFAVRRLSKVATAPIDSRPALAMDCITKLAEKGLSKTLPQAIRERFQAYALKGPRARS